MNPMPTAPRDGTRFLMLRNVRHFSGRYCGSHDEMWPVVGTKWEECRWDTALTPSWKPWCGTPRATTTDCIDEEDALGWLPLPEEIALESPKGERMANTVPRGTQ